MLRMRNQWQGGREIQLRSASPQALVPYRRRSPGLAAILSVVFPGLGQVYNGQFGKAVFFFCTAWLIIPYFIGVADAYLSARRISETSDRFLYHNLMISLESPQQAELAPVPGQPHSWAQPPPLPMESDHDYQKARHERRMITGGGMVGAGVLLEVLAVAAGGGIGVAVMGCFPLLFGGILGFWNWKQYRRLKTQQEQQEEKRLEKIVVTLAQRKGGKLSVTDLVAGTDLGMQDAEKILNRFVTKGYADVTVDDQGLIEYQFPIH